VTTDNLNILPTSPAGPVGFVFSLSQGKDEKKKTSAPFATFAVKLSVVFCGRLR
jgi:hypothetical protein